MKYSVFLLVTIAALAAADKDWEPVIQPEMSVKIHEDCSKEAGLNAEQNQKALKIEYPDEPEVRAYLLCCVKKIGVFIDGKGFSADRLMMQYNGMFGDVEAERGNVQNCVDSNEQKSPDTALAYSVVECVMKTKIGELLVKSQYVPTTKS